jgi:16S rRNA (guanine1207-N2)-methyltransferase
MKDQPSSLLVYTAQEPKNPASWGPLGGSQMRDQPRSTRALLELLHYSAPGATLDIGSDLGAIAQVTGCAYVDADLVSCELAQQAGVSIVQHSDVLPGGMYSTICFDARTYDPGLAADTVAQTARILAPDGVLITTARLADVESAFGEVTAHGEALIARAPRREVKGPDWPTYTVDFDGRTFTIQSGPGVFSPRGLDEGTRFMLEQIKAQPGARLLDLGCGIGIVSLIATELWDCDVTAVDVNARALRLTAINAPRAQVVASDGLRGLGEEPFALIASNPPYHTDFAVAKQFIEGAHRHLSPGGILYLVVKRADWYIQKVRQLFGGCRIATRDGYTVIIAERMERTVKATPPAPSMTRKHAKRMAATKKKGPR